MSRPAEAESPARGRTVRLARAAAVVVTVWSGCHSGSETSAVAGPPGAGLPTPSVSADDLCAGMVQDRTDRPMTPLPKPGLYETVVDPQFNTRIRRITAAGENGAALRPVYATVSAWNANESYLILFEVNGGRHRLHDGRTYQFIRYLEVTPPDLEQIYWHTTDPDIIFYASGKSLIRYHVSSGQKEVLHTFGFCAANVTGGGNPMFALSLDSARIGLGCGNQIFIYDIPTDTILGQRTLATYAPQMAPSGTLAYLGGIPYEPGGGKVVDLQLNVQRSLDLKEPWGTPRWASTPTATIRGTAPSTTRVPPGTTTSGCSSPGT